MRLEELDYELPRDRIAQRPAPRRDDARLLVVERATGKLTDASVHDLPGWLPAGDALVLNETRVRHARLFVHGPGGGTLELLFVRAEEGGLWRVLARPARRLAPGVALRSADGALRLEVVRAGERGERLLRVLEGDVEATLRASGEIPLPPYIRRRPTPEDAERYQTVFARVPGAVAAPTAGLHFTPDLLGALAARGVMLVRLVLHVGPGTFRPITAPRIEDHRVEAEWFEVGEEAAGALRAARAGGGRIVAVGTTVVRALESAAQGGGLGPASGFTRLFIHPPYAFHAVDAMLTNFHLPRTSLLCLVSAFTGVELTRRAYAHAVERGYRFYSYGDAMLVL